jgi:hypothetical protein
VSDQEVIEIVKTDSDDQAIGQEREVEPIFNHEVPKRDDARGGCQHDKEKEDAERDQPFLIN